MTKIAIVEDDPVIHQMYRMKFEAEGFNVEMADNGLEAISLVKNFKPDIILMDLQMPEMDGAQALTEIRKIPGHKTTPVYILTNVGAEEAPAELADLGISGYIVKAEYTPTQVFQKVKTTISGKPD